MKVLVTGCDGFLGKHLVLALLNAGARNSVAGIDIANSPEQDVRDDVFMLRAAEDAKGYDACVHLAAIAAPDKCKADPTLAYETNVRGTFNVLRLCERAGIRRVVFLSSAHVYGITPPMLPTPETCPFALHDPYTVSKILAEQLVHLFWENHGIAYTTLRLFNGYGQGQSDQYFVGVKLAQARGGSPVTIRNGSVTKDFVHVSDVVRATILALESDFVGPVNIGTGVETRLDAIAAQIALSYKVDMVEEPSDGSGPTRMCADWRRAKSVLGWEPKVTVEEGIRELCEETK
jgi:UDP-glucose 4-epimerase